MLPKSVTHPPREICHLSAPVVPRMRPNPSLKRSDNGRPPGPVWRYAVHFLSPGPGVTPSAPPLARTLGVTSNMFHRFRREIRKVFGYRFIEVVEDKPALLSLSCGLTKTDFDRVNSKVLQNGRLVAMAQLVEKIELHQPANQDGPLNWFITLHVRGSRQVEVGQITDSTDASIIAARISTVVGRPVVLRK
jgi:hypothetical protein